MLIYAVRCWRFVANETGLCDEILRDTKQGKVLGVILDNILKFTAHLLNIIYSISHIY